MLNEHSKVGIAQTVFYVPIVPLAIYLLYRNAGKSPRMAWIPLVPFSLSKSYCPYKIRLLTAA